MRRAQAEESAQPCFLRPRPRPSSPAPRQFAKLQVQRSQRPLPKCPDDQLGFGKVITDHMLQVKWSAGKGWGAPRIIPVDGAPTMRCMCGTATWITSAVDT